MSSENTKSLIRRKLCEIMNVGEINDDTASLVNLGFNSILTIRFVVELEVMFGITVDDDELLLENFSTVDMIDGFVSRKIA